MATITDWRLYELLAPDKSNWRPGAEPDQVGCMIIYVEYQGKRVRLPLPKGASVDACIRKADYIIITDKQDKND